MFQILKAINYPLRMNIWGISHFVFIELSVGIEMLQSWLSIIQMEVLL